MKKRLPLPPKARDEIRLAMLDYRRDWPQQHSFQVGMDVSTVVEKVKAYIHGIFFYTKQ